MEFGPHGPRRLRSSSAPLAAAIVAAALAAACGKKEPALTPIPAYACSRPVAATTYTGGTVQLLGHRTVGSVVQFDVPPNTASITIVTQGVKSLDTVTLNGKVYDNFVTPDVITDPTGKVWYDASWTAPDPSSLKVYYVSYSVSTAAITIPNTTTALATPLPEGRWKFTVFDNAEAGTYEPGVYDFTVMTKPGPVGLNGLVDVAFYLVTNSGLTAAGAETDQDILRLRQTLGSYLAGAGLGLGVVNFYDVSNSAKQNYASLDVTDRGPCGPLAQLLTLSDPSLGNRLNVFLVDEVFYYDANGQPNYSYVGIDGTIPGPSSFGGTIASGMVASMANLGAIQPGGSCTGSLDLRCGDDYVAYIAAHEMGHFLGLYHTTESDGRTFDPITDTPPGVADNLMFWSVTRSSTISQGNISTQQGKVMRANPAVQ